MTQFSKDAIRGLRLIFFPKTIDNGGLTVFENSDERVPFEMRRAFSITGVKPGTTRGNHAHNQCTQLLVSLVGKVIVEADDGGNKFVFELKDDGVGLLIPPLVWSSIGFEDESTLLMVFCDSLFDEDEYIRDRSVFLSL